jgi:hypothetical protein
MGLLLPWMIFLVSALMKNKKIQIKIKNQFIHPAPTGTLCINKSFKSGGNTNSYFFSRASISLKKKQNTMKVRYEENIKPVSVNPLSKNISFLMRSNSSIGSVLNCAINFHLPNFSY